jgi:oligogalacturonide lyase
VVSLRPHKRRFRDPVTGRPVWQVTDGDAMHHHLYFLTPTWTPDGRWLICVRYDEGRPNLLAVEDDTGAEEPLTRIEDLTAFSACPARDGRGVFYTAGAELRRVDIGGGPTRVLAHFADGVPSNCALNHDGTLIVTNVRRPAGNAITVVAADGSGARVVLETEREVGHVQFDPTPACRILYSGDLRTVNLDGSGDRLLYTQQADEFLVHEFWSRDGEEVFVVHWPFALRAIRREGERIRTVLEMNAWHVSQRPDGGMLVCDTNHPDTGLHLIDPATGRTRFLCESRASNLGTQWRHRYPREGAHMDVTMFQRGVHAEETPWGPQWTHPHPSFHPRGDRVAFTSDRSGRSQVYVVEEVPLTLAGTGGR